MDKDRIEDMLSQLIRMVGSIQSEQTEMKEDIQQLNGRVGRIETKVEQLETKVEQLDTKVEQLDMKVDQLDMKVDQNEMNSEKRHVETLKKMRELKIDQEFTWEKTVRNEREIEHLKKS